MTGMNCIIGIGKAGGLLAIVELCRDQLVTLIILISVPLHNRSVQSFLHVGTVTHKVILERVDAGAIIVLGLRSGQELSGCIIGKCPVGLHDLVREGCILVIVGVMSNCLTEFLLEKVASLEIKIGFLHRN